MNQEIKWFKPPETIISRDNWPPNYSAVFAWRQQQFQLLRSSRDMLRGALEYYRTNAVDWINGWADTVDPRNAGQPGKLVRMPFVLFERQAELIEFVLDCQKQQQNGLVEKVRTAGATWTCCALSVHQWRFVPGTSIGWGSRKEQLVDKIGDMDSIFEKMRTLIRGLPSIFWPTGFNPDSDKHLAYMRIVNPDNGATITGEAGDNIGRGGRKTLYFVDEAAHLERPELIEASLSENTRVRIDVSSVNGFGNPFHRKRENGVEWSPSVDIEPGKTRVFIFDVFDHPANTKEWYDQRKKKFEDDGLAHIFAQEIERNYSASVDGIIIPAEWVKACVDAHLNPACKITDDGPWCGSLDVADGGGDRNAFTGRKGVILRIADEWGAPDTGASARRAIGLCEGFGEADIQYDSIGVGSGVKAEMNRLELDGVMPKGLTWIAWNAGAAVQKPFDNIIPGDKSSLKNVDFYRNLKAQAWWNLRMRCYRTYQVVNGLATYDPELLISIDSKIKFLQSILKELSQVVAIKSTNLKLMVDKTPEGTRSPNLADSVVMNYFPARANAAKPLFGVTSGS